MDELLFLRRFVGVDQLNYWVDARVFQDPLLAQIVESAFPRVFLEVWAKIPPADRQRILDYWRPHWAEGVTAQRPADDIRIPYIRIKDADMGLVPTQANCENAGRTLTFSVSLILAAPDRLAGEIARVLAEVHQWAMFERYHHEHVYEALRGWGFATVLG